jgi:hypothetical protein
VFAYNRTVNNFGGVTITNVYNKAVVVNNVSRTSFNGGARGTTARPTAEEQAFAHERHVPPTPGQVLHEKTASTDKSLLASVNHGRPARSRRNRRLAMSAARRTEQRHPGPMPRRRTNRRRNSRHDFGQPRFARADRG